MKGKTINMKKKNHSDRGHKETSGSGASRWPRCSASVILARKIKPRPPSRSMLRGTDTHELAEVCGEDFLNHKLEGTDPELNYKKEKAFRDENQIESAEFYRDYIWNEVLGNSVTNKAWGFEEKVEHAKCDKRGGTVDFWCAHINDKAERVLHIVDFKNGVKPVDIKDEQFIEYGLCMRSMLQSQGKDIDRLITHVVSPNSSDGKMTQTKGYTPKQMDAKDAWFMKAIHRIYVDKKIQYKLGDWCGYCSAKGICEKYAAKTEVETGLSLLKEEIKLPDVSTLSEQQIVNLALHHDKLNSLCKACKAVIIGEHMNGTPYGGCKVVQTRPRRSMPKDSSKLEKKLKKSGYTEDEIYTKKIKGITALEKTLGKKKKILEKYVSVGKPTAIVTTADDERPVATDLTDLLME